MCRRSLDLLCAWSLSTSHRSLEVELRRSRTCFSYVPSATEAPLKAYGDLLEAGGQARATDGSTDRRQRIARCDARAVLRCRQPGETRGEPCVGFRQPHRGARNVTEMFVFLVLHGDATALSSMLCVTNVRSHRDRRVVRLTAPHAHLGTGLTRLRAGAAGGLPLRVSHRRGRHDAMAPRALR
jgi:hypothetical protein